MSVNSNPAAKAAQEELSAFLDDILDLARSGTGLDAARLDELKQGFRDRMEQIGSEAGGVARDAADRIAGHADEALREADRYAREKPWHLIAAAGLIGLAVGVLVARR